MLVTVFLICAVFGGALVLLQLLLSVLAFGIGHGIHFHHHHSAPGATHAGLQRHIGARSHGRAISKAGLARGVAKSTAPRAAAAASLSHNAAWLLSWLHSLLNFQGLVAGATVFGLAGLAAAAAKMPQGLTFVIALLAGFFMTIAVAGAFSIMLRFDDDGTVRLDQAIGEVGTVYLSIPACNQGQGKITLPLQQQLMEFPAVTFQDKPLARGDKAIVVSVGAAAVMEVVSADGYFADMRQ